jgi:histone deacetylase 1/2
MGQDLPDKLPDSALNEYNYYLDTGALRIAVSNMKNMNTRSVSK